MLLSRCKNCKTYDKLTKYEIASEVWLKCNYGYKQSKEVRVVKNLDVLFYVLVSFIRCLLKVSKLVFEALVDLLVVALLLLHLLELRLDMLAQIINGGPRRKTIDKKQDKVF